MKGRAVRIEGSDIAFATRHTEAAWERKRERVTAWAGTEAPRIPAQGRASPDVVTLSARAARWTAPPPPPSPPPESPAGGEDPKLLVTRLLLEVLLGKKLRFFAPDAPSTSRSSPNLPAPPPAPSGAVNAAGTPPAGVGWGLEISSTVTRGEGETTVVEAQGTVKTADGREFGVAAAFSMSREWVEQVGARLALGDAALPKDPLVLNFGGAATSLSGASGSFDLNADGRDETMALLASGSAFLALDRSGNGEIDDGRELFGPTTGNGFDELSAQDADGNGWIDEGDPVFGRLRLWSRDAEGNDRVATLAEKGVGALYLGRVDSPFALKDQNRQLQAQVRATGVFLREDGSAGTLQQVDWVV